ncbi:MAG: phosphate ABC transporter substrate-binding protein [Spirochaetia bacterium]
MKKGVLILMVAVVSAGLAFGSGAPEGAASGFKGTYKFGGSTTVDPIARGAIEAFAKKYPGAKISYDAQGSGPGIAGVTSGVYSLGGSSRDLTQEEKGAGLIENIIALDGLAIIVNDDVPIADLSRRQTADIFNGSIVNWKQLGGPDQPIVVITRDEASGTRVAMVDLVLTKEYKKADPKASFMKDAVTVTSNGDMVTKVGSTPYSIGYCGEGFLDQAKSSGAKPVSVNGIVESTKNVLNKSYPISRYLYFISKGALKEGSVEKAFVDFVLSPEGQAIVKQEGFIALPK